MIDSTRIKQFALQAGFDLCGIAAPDKIPSADKRYRDWLESEFHGEMTYLARDPGRRSDLREVMPSVNSVIMLAINYYQPNSEQVPGGFGRVSRYSRGRDYHKIIAKKTKQMIALILNEMNQLTANDFRWFVDYGPVLERAYAEKAGLGFIGKNSMLISRQFGSWLFLSEILTSLKLEPDDPAAVNHGRCGSPGNAYRT
jgi:epoxyqueuosine reductase